MTGGGAVELLALAVIALGALVTGAVLSVIRLHALALRRAPTSAGIPSWHVVGVSSAHLCFVAGAGLGALDLLGALDTPPELRLGLYVAGAMLTLPSLYVVGRSQTRRVARKNARIAVTPDDYVPTSHRWRRGERPGRADTQPTPAVEDGER